MNEIRRSLETRQKQMADLCSHLTLLTAELTKIKGHK